VLQPQTKMIFYASFGGSVLFKIKQEIITTIKSMDSTNMRSQYGMTHAQNRGGLELNYQDSLLDKHKLLSQQIEVLDQQMAKLPQQIQAMQVASFQLNQF